MRPPQDLQKVTLNQILEANSIKEDDCTVWIGGKNNFGYGQFRFEGKMILAHRASWESEDSPIPPGMQVLHKCDNPSCINKKHLFLGSQRDNIHDAMAKGHRYKHERKITTEQKEEVKKLHSEGMAYKAIGAKFGVTKQTIYKYIHGFR